MERLKQCYEEIYYTESTMVSPRYLMYVFDTLF